MLARVVDFGIANPLLASASLRGSQAGQAFVSSARQRSLSDLSFQLLTENGCHDLCHDLGRLALIMTFSNEKPVEGDLIWPVGRTNQTSRRPMPGTEQPSSQERARVSEVSSRMPTAGEFSLLRNVS